MATNCNKLLSITQDSEDYVSGKILSWVGSALLLVFMGCGDFNQGSSLFRSKTFHQKLGLEAENFFDDPRVIELCSRIERNDLDGIKQLIVDGVDHNSVGRHGVTPLFWAFPDNQLDRFVLLLEQGADPNVKITSNLGHPNAFRAGDTVTHLSARSQFPNHFLEVMKHGGDPRLTGKSGDTVIHELIKAGVPNPIKRIEAALKNGADINAYSRSGYTPVHLAVASFSQYQLAIKLLELGADPTIVARGNMNNAIHSVLALKRRVIKGQAVLSVQESKALAAFVANVAELGYDVDEAQADIDRWAKLASEKPGNPGWFRESEIALAQKRAELRQKNQ